MNTDYIGVAAVHAFHNYLGIHFAGIHFDTVAVHSFAVDHTVVAVYIRYYTADCNSAESVGYKLLAEFVVHIAVAEVACSSSLFDLDSVLVSESALVVDHTPVDWYSYHFHLYRY
jgi:hypothetical protein